MLKVLVVEDQPAVCTALELLFDLHGVPAIIANDPERALAIIASEDIGAVVQDMNFRRDATDGAEGTKLLGDIKRLDPDLPVLLMTGDPSLDGAVRALDDGAVSYLAKPFDQEALASGVARAARRHGVARMRRRAETFARELDGDLVERFDRALASSWMAFQPIVDVRKGTVFAYEALVRNDEDSMKRPDVLIATAERLDRVHDLGRTVRAGVARAACDLPPDVLLFVNVHGLELTDEDLYASTGPFAVWVTMNDEPE